MKNKKILFIPQVTLRNGVCPFCYNLIKKNENLITEINNNPAKLCELLQLGNAQTIQIKDIDSFLNIDNSSNINTILLIANTLHINISVHSDFKNINECRYLLENKIQRIVIGKLSIIDPEGVACLIEEFSNSRICIDLQSSNSIIKYPDLNYENNILSYIQNLTKININRILYYDNEWDFAGEIDFSVIKSISEQYSMNITISNGIYNSKQLLKLVNTEHYNIDSIIISDALFKQNFPCQNIWRF